jgi:hypothetical protein
MKDDKKISQLFFTGNGDERRYDYFMDLLITMDTHGVKPAPKTVDEIMRAELPVLFPPFNQAAAWKYLMPDELFIRTFIMMDRGVGFKEVPWIMERAKQLQLI